MGVLDGPFNSKFEMDMLSNPLLYHDIQYYPNGASQERGILLVNPLVIISTNHPSPETVS